ncbi:MAG: molecular chaperone TorD family protein [Gammaproteobacteria bacterium]|nr:molecular chaperone TorD family protein [Gammaproteobacteria bacterium]
MSQLIATDSGAGAPSPAAIYSQLYGLLGECVSATRCRSCRECAAAHWHNRRELFGELDAGFLESLDISALEDEAATSDALTVEFTRLFDAGARGTACPLNGGLQVGPQMKVMEEAVRFYAHFGLTLTEEQKELPDHLTTELNFLHFLACGEHELRARGASTTAYRLARRDFIARHPGRWVPVMKEKLQTMNPLPLFQVLSELLDRLLRHDLAELEACHGKAPLQPSGELPFGGL